jgi:hydrogenase maturation factor HypF (carbamoyltransferase family)
VAFWHQKPKRQCYFGKCGFSGGILANSVLTNGIVAILSKSSTSFFLAPQAPQIHKGITYDAHTVTITP